MRSFVRSFVMMLLLASALCVNACAPWRTAQPSALKPLANSTPDARAFPAPGPDNSASGNQGNTGNPADPSPNPGAVAALPLLQAGSKGPAVERLQQLLGELGYLPMRWVPDGPEPQTLDDEYRAVQSPPKGQWRPAYPNTPPALTALWEESSFNTLVRGAVMTFQEAKGLGTDGVVGPQTWNALLKDALAEHQNPFGYTFVVVNTRVPQTVTVWWNGKTVLASPANAGIAQSPTVRGTFPVYLRYRTQTMSGVTPWGEHYSDPGVPYVSYFYGGEAVHGFVRASYGTPQSLGCVELPVDKAAVAWGYMHYGTLVHVQ
ncbi:L,D-transpeptidase family protein [Alicyclobacillus macrosporangiidus]|uniref:Peptidoglycan-binding (PGRP) domain of peptidoglycan hydrolases-containing protein n=1 Tax=Alicyclobacillus macrosporangiidus TaxID=392015 RepID=A0A1I7JPC3_9BACL|nr:peptidoglycan-binding protein [Alicyclobacillus macrosporangiidus]SFU87044.1 Peptidoglycan-binding (PGRP) domain of peptidoglycan hydrolases-containing protein [Alicyclobacillus macrosporangiidus]